MLTHIGTNSIETERLILRRFEYSDDLEMLYNELQKRIKPNRVREMTDTGPSPSISRRCPSRIWTGSLKPENGTRTSPA